MRAVVIMGILSLLSLFNPEVVQANLPSAFPGEVGLDPAKLAQIDSALVRALERHDVPGAVLLVGRRGRIVYSTAVGFRSLTDHEVMTRDTSFDLASLTKPLATASSILVLLDLGKIELQAPVSRYWPEFDNAGKGVITVEQLLRHRSGLIADNPLSDYAGGPDKAWERIAHLGLVGKPGEKFLYSDVNYEVLGRLVEQISGNSLDQFARTHLFEPMQVGATYRPGEPSQVAPTERDGANLLRGVVHDPRARALGGIAGHAGLFGTADDLAVIAQMWLNGGVAPNGRRILQASTVALAINPGTTPPQQKRGLGWDIDTSFSGPRGSGFGPSSFGHTGFTGTSVWIDPDSAMFVIVLTSRLHPDGKGKSPTKLRNEVASLAAAAISTPKAEREPTEEVVQCGIDVLLRDQFASLRGKRVGLVTNHTGRTRSGSATIDVLFRAPEVQLVALFSPEHGIRGLVDAEVADSSDPATGLPIHSLYGKTRKPTPESLTGVDVLVYDIQDIGTRFYTYISTLGLVLEAAKERGIRVVVLDRPNPIGGVAVAGPVRDDGLESFIAHHAIPVRHGMTVGELAQLFNSERNIHADLTIIPCEGWRRSDLFDRTGLLWVNPSPNMRSLTEALIYPGVGLLELSNLATGRGTDTPFERFGAPWIDPVVLARDLNGRHLPGIRFTPSRFTPRERQYSGQDCGGVQVVITDWAKIEPVGMGVAIACSLHKLYPAVWKSEGFARMLADKATAQAVLDGRDLGEIEPGWQAELEAFRAVRAKYLIYPEG